MIIKDAEYKICSKCGQKTGIKREKIYGCDNCKKVIPPENTYPLEIYVWYDVGEDAKGFIFCSWKCLFSFLKKKEKKIKYMVSLPPLDGNGSRNKVSDLSNFLELINIRGNKK